MSELQTAIEASVGSFPGVSVRMMFGCPGIFAHGQLFALVWKAGRIGLRLPDAAAFAELEAQPGAEPWAPDGGQQGGWVLVPESWHAEPGQLARWAVRAHGLAVEAARAEAEAEPAALPALVIEAKPQKAKKAKKPAPGKKTIAKKKGTAGKARSRKPSR